MCRETSSCPTVPGSSGLGRPGYLRPVPAHAPVLFTVRGGYTSVPWVPHNFVDFRGRAAPRHSERFGRAAGCAPEVIVDAC